MLYGNSIQIQTFSFQLKHQYIIVDKIKMSISCSHVSTITCTHTNWEGLVFPLHRENQRKLHTSPTEPELQNQRKQNPHLFSPLSISTDL